MLLAFILAAQVRQLGAPTALYTLEHDRLSAAEMVVAQTLQGVVGKSGPHIWLRTGGVQALILQDLVREGRRIQPEEDVWKLVERFKSSITGVVVYKLGTHSLNVATSLCGPMRAIAVDQSLVEEAKSKGLPVLADVRGISEPEAFSKYHQLFRKGIVVEQSVQKPGALRDFAALHDAFVMDTQDREFRMKVIREMGPNVLVFGWGPDEYEWITDVSKAGGTGVAADWCINLSALETLKSRHVSRPKWNRLLLQKDLRYVAFVMSDGDNVQWQTGGFATDTKFYGSTFRGSFPVTWEVSPLLSCFAPLVLDEIYSKATVNDDFITGAGLPGYTYPHVLPDRPATAKLSEPYMKSSGMRIASILNQNEGSLDEAIPWLSLAGVDAVVYKDYSPYNGRRGQVVWHNGKPVVAYRFVLWENLQGIRELASEIARMPIEPSTNEGRFALINVHAWSYASIGGPMEAIRRTIEKLPPKTRVVTASQLIDLMKQAKSN